MFLNRFQRERQPLATLEIEHIVSFLDAEALPDGRPFLVMELVEGVGLTVWARGQPLRKKLELFLRVLATVQYAHQQLVVHRDLKPSNVLVTKQGVLKLLDFGVASVLETDGLGVLLHELVTGVLPIPTSDAPGGTIEGDLGRIVAKGLAPEPSQRYGSAEHMAEDLRRHLRSEPVSVGPGTWRYRMSLFVRRHSWPLVLASAILIALVVGWVGSDLERRMAQREAGFGWGAHSQSRIVAHVFEDWVVAASTKNPAMGNDLAEYLELALREDLGQLSETETLIHMTLARIYLDRSEQERAAPHALRAWELAQTIRGLGKSVRLRAAKLHRRAGPR